MRLGNDSRQSPGRVPSRSRHANGVLTAVMRMWEALFAHSLEKRCRRAASRQPASPLSPMGERVSERGDSACTPFCKRSLPVYMHSPWAPVPGRPLRQRTPDLAENSFF